MPILWSECDVPDITWDTPDDLIGDSEEFILLAHNEDVVSMFNSTIIDEKIWNKFEFDTIGELSCSFDTTELNGMETLNSELRSHDCMWNGRCTHAEHGDNLTPPSSPLFEPKVIRPQNSRSLLVSRQHQKQQCYHSNNNNNNKYNNNNSRTLDAKMVVNKFVKNRMNSECSNSEHRPETPISDFDEPSPLQHDLLSEADSTDDDDDFESSDSQSDREIVKREGFFNDHSYHMVKTTVTTEGLGVQTPSDSEEEIDVVSVGEKPARTEPMLIETKPVIIRNSRNLPTNPSPSDKQQLQLSMAMAAVKTRPSSVVPPLRIRLESAKKKRQQQDESDEEVAQPRRKRPVKRKTTNYDSSSASSSPRKRGSRSCSDSEDSTGKRSLHNTMERQRRVDLRNAFESLRVLVPKLEDVDKAPKVHILKESMLYCRSLQHEESALDRKELELKRKQAQLRDRVSQLRRSLAAHR